MYYRTYKGYIAIEIFDVKNVCVINQRVHIARKYGIFLSVINSATLCVTGRNSVGYMHNKLKQVHSCEKIENFIHFIFKNWIFWSFFGIFLKFAEYLMEFFYFKFKACNMMTSVRGSLL